MAILNPPSSILALASPRQVNQPLSPRNISYDFDLKHCIIMRYVQLVNPIAVRWLLAGKNSFNRWRCWRDLWAVFTDQKV